MVCVHCLVTLSITINETSKQLSLLPILMQESFWWRHCNNRYTISLFPHLRPSLISLVISVDVKHPVYFPTLGALFFLSFKHTEECTVGGVLEDVHLVEIMYLVFTHTPGESYRRRLRSLLLYLCYVFRALISSFVCWLSIQNVKKERWSEQDNIKHEQMIRVNSFFKQQADW